MRTLLQKHSRYVSVCPDDTGHQMTESFPGIQSRGQRLRGFHWQILCQVGGQTPGSGSWSLATRLGGQTLTLSPRSSRGMWRRRLVIRRRRPYHQLILNRWKYHAQSWFQV